MSWRGLAVTICVIPAAWACGSIQRLRGCKEGSTLVVLWGLLDLGGGALSAAVFCSGWALSCAVAVFREELSWYTLFSAIIYWAWALPGAVLGEKLCWCALFTPVFCGGLALLRAGALAVFLNERCWCKLSVSIIEPLGIIFWWDIRWWLLRTW